MIRFYPSMIMITASNTVFFEAVIAYKVYRTAHSFASYSTRLLPRLRPIIDSDVLLLTLTPLATAALVRLCGGAVV